MIARKDTPLFRTAYSKTGNLTKTPVHVIDICRMVKRRLRDASLPARLSPHSFRVTTITDLLEQGVPLEDVQRLAGHADPRTTRLDRRDKKITRNIVERISI
jgi:integrase